MTEQNDTCGSSDLLQGLSLSEQVELLRALADAAGDAIVAHQPGGRLVFFNRAACELLGMSSREMANLAPFGWVSPDAMQGAPGRLETILHRGRLTFPSSIRRADGTTVVTEVSATRVTTKLGPLIVAVIHDASARHELETRLRHLAYHDGLTGLANRAMFEERIQLAIADARRYKDTLALAYIDLDHFKPINDDLGHRVGDQVLIEVAQRLLEAVRVQDLVVRIGGDEFVVILQRVESIDQIPGIGHRLHDTLCQPMEACGENCRVDASIGFAVYDPEVDDARSLLVKADHAMYAAKGDPLHPWLLWNPELKSPAV